jgi:hypothetical protein
MSADSEMLEKIDGASAKLVARIKSNEQARASLHPLDDVGLRKVSLAIHDDTRLLTELQYRRSQFAGSRDDPRGSSSVFIGSNS